MSKTDWLVKKIVEVANSRHPDSEIYLYGSRARGDAKIYSDWDLLILINSPKVSFDIETTLMDEYYELELETGEVISPLIYSKSDWNSTHPSTSLFENVQKEGIRIK